MSRRSTPNQGDGEIGVFSHARTTPPSDFIPLASEQSRRQMRASLCQKMWGKKNLDHDKVYYGCAGLLSGSHG